MGVTFMLILCTLWFGGIALCDWREGKTNEALAWGVASFLGVILVVLNLLDVHA